MPEKQIYDEVRPTRQLIIHCDDLGLAHSVNKATFVAFRSGAITSASVMVPCPWFSEVAEYARRNPQWDLGVHLTLTSEWAFYRWSPVAPLPHVRSLVGTDGYFHRSVDPLMEMGKPAEVEIEMRAQIERAIQFGVKPTHMDSHMFAVSDHSEFYERFVRLADEYRIPCWTRPSKFTTSGGLGKQAILAASIQRIFHIRPTVANEAWLTWYIDALRAAEAGVNLMIVHLGIADSELKAITAGRTAWGALWRQMDYQIVSSSEFRSTLAAENIALVTWQRAAVCPRQCHATHAQY